MEKNPLLLQSALLNQVAVSEIIECNKFTVRYGLTLSLSEAEDLVKTRTDTLNRNGRIEFAGGIINKLIRKFCDSPYLYQFNYASTLNDLIETFYYYKNETLEEISDDDLINLMKDYFDHTCQGSIELLQNRELYILARNIRFGKSCTPNPNENLDDEADKGGNYEE